MHGIGPEQFFYLELNLPVTFSIHPSIKECQKTLKHANDTFLELNDLSSIRLFCLINRTKPKNISLKIKLVNK